MSNLSSINAVVFDMDGVLVDTSPCHEKAYDRLWSKLGLRGPKYEQLAGRSTKEVIKQVCGHFTPSERHKWVTYKQNEALKLLRSADIIFPDTVSTLKTLHGAGFKLALATSASRPSASLVLERLGAAEWFDIVITADDVEKAKPDPEIFIRAIQTLGLEPSKTLIIEDSRAGIESGLACGAKVINVRHRANFIEHGNFYGFHENLNEVTQLLPGGVS